MPDLFRHQQNVLDATAEKTKVAYYLDMGLGKTFVGAEKLIQLGARQNLVICQKSKLDDWAEHFRQNYDLPVIVYRKPQQLPDSFIIVINYDLVWRRPELLALSEHTILLDESSQIQNRTSERSKFMLQSQPANVILLSGTPIGGKYESLWTQCRLLGWPISEELFVKHFCNYHFDTTSGFPRKVITGYKNVDRLKTKLAQYGAVFMKTEEVLDLPEQIEQIIPIPATTQYHKFARDRVLSDPELVGDNSLTHLLGMRRLCGAWNAEKLSAVADILDSCDDRVVIFYNFNEELAALRAVCQDRPLSFINGTVKDLTAYEQQPNAVTLVQYQAGAMGLNLQWASRMVFFTLPLSSELYEQAKKRIHRIGQSRTCHYLILLAKDSIEEKIKATLDQRKDYTDELFRRDHDRNTV